MKLDRTAYLLELTDKDGCWIHNRFYPTLEAAKEAGQEAMKSGKYKSAEIGHKVIDPSFGYWYEMLEA